MKREIVVSVLASIGVTLLLVNWLSDGRESQKETSFERVSRTGILRCGYGVWEPFVRKDPNTGQVSGFWVEAMENMAKLAGFKIEWTTETDWGLIAQDLQQGKIDAHCAGMWPNSNRGRNLLFTKPLTYMPTVMIVRVDDQRFPNTVRLKDINIPQYTIGVLEGDVTDAIAQGDIPLAKRHAFPILYNWGQVLAELVSRKYDFTVGPAISVQDMVTKGLAVRAVPIEPAPRIYGNVNAVAAGEHNLRDWLNAATDEFLGTAAYQALFSKYATQYPGGIQQPMTQYQ